MFLYGLVFHSQVMGSAVYKFGGTSQGSSIALNHCLDILRADKNNKAVIVSAPSGVTNLLKGLSLSAFEGAFDHCDDYINKIKQRFVEVFPDSSFEGIINQHIDSLSGKIALSKILSKENFDVRRFEADILSFGENLESVLFSDFLNNSGIRTALFPVDNIRLSGGYLNAVYESVNDGVFRRYMNDAIRSGSVLLIPGFIGKNKRGESVVFDRGGSDYTQALFARAINADVAYNCTDVNGVLPINPSFLNVGERVALESISHMSYNQAQELSRQGAKVLHPRCIIPLKQKNIDLYVCNTFDFYGSKTLINGFENNKELLAVTGKNDGYVNVTLRTGEMEGRSGYVLAFANALKDVDIDTLATSAVEIQASFAHNGVDLDKIKADLSGHGDVRINNGSALIAIVGSNLNKSRYVGEFFTKLHDEGISVNQITKSNNTSLWVSIPSSEYVRAQVAVYGGLLKN